MLLQGMPRMGAWLLVPFSGGLQLPVIPACGIQCPLLSFKGTHAHMHIQQREAYTAKNKICLTAV